MRRLRTTPGLIQFAAWVVMWGAVGLLIVFTARTLVFGQTAEQRQRQWESEAYAEQLYLRSLDNLRYQNDRATDQYERRKYYMDNYLDRQEIETQRRRETDPWGR
jgi:hypothetical protein